MATYLLDTNILLRLMNPREQEHGVCRRATTRMTVAGHTLLLAPQVLYEFWVVATRPRDARGFGWTTTRTESALDHLLMSFQLYPEAPELFEVWRMLVLEGSIVGKRAHDARIAAFKNLYEIDYLITLNGDDFLGLADGIVTPEQALEHA